MYHRLRVRSHWATNLRRRVQPHWGVCICMWLNGYHAFLWGYSHKWHYTPKESIADANTDAQCEWVFTSNLIAKTGINPTSFLVAILVTKLVAQCERTLIRHTVNSALWLIRTNDELDKLHWLGMFKMHFLCSTTRNSLPGKVTIT